MKRFIIVISMLVFSSVLFAGVLDEQITSVNDKINSLNFAMMQNEATMYRLQQENIAYANQIKVLQEYRDELIEKRKRDEGKE